MEGGEEREVEEGREVGEDRIMDIVKLVNKKHRTTKQANESDEYLEQIER